MLAILERIAVIRSGKEIKFYYCNWRGKTALRTIIPIKLWYGSTKWHPEKQWFIRATDVEKGEERDFALLDMKFLDT